MSKLTFFKNYNNYYNRIVKNNKKEDLSIYEKVNKENINFNPANDINTEIVVNWDKDWTPDYLMVDEVINNIQTRWINYLTGFYFSQTSSDTIVDIKGSHEEVMNSLKHYPVWDEDTSQNIYKNYLSEDETAINIGDIYSDFKGEVYWNYYQLGFDFTDMSANAFSMQLSDTSNYSKYVNISVYFKNPNTYVTFKSTDVPQEGITFDFLRRLVPSIGKDSVIYNVQFDPNNQDDVTDSQFCPNIVSSTEVTIVLLNKIASSWFIIDFDRTRKGQYKVSLKRDLIADNYDIIINSPAYIEKATIKNLNDPAIFNKEELLVNQIKKQEKLLKDKTNMAWLVAWINNNIDKDTWLSLFHEKSVPYTRNISANADYTTDNIATWISSHQLSGTYKCLKETDDYMWFKVQNELADTATRIVWAWMDYKIYRDGNHENSGGVGNNKGTSYTYNFKDKTSYATMLSQTETINDSLYQAVKSAEGFITGTDPRFSFINKIVKETKDGVSKYYKIEASYSDWNNSATYSNTSAVANLFTNLPNGQKSTVSVTFKGDYVTFSYKDITNEMATTANIYADVSTITPNNSGLIDAPYMAVCIPYTLNESLTGKQRQDVISDGSFNAKIDNTKAFAAITLLSYCLQDGKHLYDVQLLPYCPIVNEINISGPTNDSFTINSSTISGNRKIKFYQTDGTTFNTTTPLMEAFVFFNSSFTFDIPLVIKDKTTVFDKKLASEIELYRFSSPNYSAFFDFNPYMNNGMTKLNVDCTYKPFKSYIHLNPDFKGLYGADFNDSRGLIITSDFSIPQVTDAWQTYQITNKNYADIFTRNQQHLEVQQKWAAREALLNTFTAPLTGGVTGGAAGAMAGGVPGMIAGAAAGAGMGLAGGIADYAKTVELNKEALNYNQDMYNYNLQNIQALPQTLSSISSYDANNKLWPFLEIYECSDIEKDAMRNKLIYNGMKIGRIDTINNFINVNASYIKAKLIRNEISNLSYNELNDIALELDKGVFI